MHHWLFLLLFAPLALGCSNATNPISYDGPIVGIWQLIALDGEARDDPITVTFHPDGRHETIQSIENGTTISSITTYRINDTQVRIDNQTFRFDVNEERLILISNNDRVREYRRITESGEPL
jgi:hypothetical protein